jgi:hypothetical protein
MILQYRAKTTVGRAGVSFFAKKPLANVIAVSLQCNSICYDPALSRAQEIVTDVRPADASCEPQYLPQATEEDHGAHPFN